ncbi:hypothetical protein CcaverHIS002_0506740 [Cutaneotrichosporon cavernicola]|uniref:Mitochondrial DNA polymerase catalytic subunit n=1 Tax=Cutaneotrichosporon cavernicola TaxID=279322 RepID=A0AA48L6X9_9TREE|nr:uncharacterized protein CcaverHIS019_0507270 [Cutaneotrichosporon cavernicola]BEI85273.1 hypothetical protein CcaverHIS002_0506740 [Cutaneotrichosporon cavernicola]BEI93099.1 hypothetical protein CcaverHIS019_0507270 [Cutaneotrichosporon cavernicola]
MAASRAIRLRRAAPSVQSTSAVLGLAAARARKSPERLDYEAALEVQSAGQQELQERQMRRESMIDKSTLPSLSKYMRPGEKASEPLLAEDALTARQLPEQPDAGPSSVRMAARTAPKATNIPPLPPSSATPAKPSRKGKERALPPPLEAYDAAPPQSQPQTISKDNPAVSARALARAMARANARRKLPSLTDRPPAAVASLSSKPVGGAAGPRRNPVGVQLLSEHMHNQVFPGAPLPTPPDALLDISKWHLGQHGLSGDGAAVLPEISLDLPPLEGRNVRDHFHALGTYASEPYLSAAKEFAAAELPPIPQHWEMSRPGWTRYGRDGSVTPVENLDGETVVSFDVETLYKLSPYPVLATAATPNAWYSWLSPSIFDTPPEDEPPKREPWDKSTVDCYPHTLIPLFKNNGPAIVVSHNVGYDRARVAEEYALERTPTRFLDTLSLHVATRGITSVQRPAWMKHRKTRIEYESNTAESIAMLREHAEDTGDNWLSESLREYSTDDDTPGSNWEDTTSLNSLAEVAALHCGVKVDKSTRQRFADETVRHASQLRPELDKLLDYCAEDVKVTHDVYKVVLPLFLTSCPHPATFAGVLAMGNSFLPVDRSWVDYLRKAEAMYLELREEVRLALRSLADRLREAGPIANDPWHSQLDWSPKSARWADGASHKTKEAAPEAEVPAWYGPAAVDRTALLNNQSKRSLLPLLMRMRYRGYPVFYLTEHLWCFKAPIEDIPELIPLHGAPVELSPKDDRLADHLETSVFFRVVGPGTARRSQLLSKAGAKDVRSGLLTTEYPDILAAAVKGELDDKLDVLAKCAQDMLASGGENDWGSQLDWVPTVPGAAEKRKKEQAERGTWPKWYWDLTVPVTNKKVLAGELDLTMRKTVAPLLLRMQWHGYPLAYSKEHKWVYRVPLADVSNDPESSLYADKRVVLSDAGDKRLADDAYAYFRLPHKDGEGNSVGNPLSKAFLRALEKGELSSALATDSDKQLAEAASKAVNMNTLCSYWISSRERIMNQFVVYNGERGMILPKVITMGTVTRRAVEATWLTASNAKKNRVGSELKSMIRAPPGYAIVGADVDSEELWISSVMGDSQFGVHGATAIGWMTLEGTKSAGTDLHSKTATILKISRDAAKVFNYSRIYGAGKPHAIQLLLQGDGKLTRQAADQLATDLYKQTKGRKTFGPPDRHGTRYLWHGGSESYLFNTLESIALMDRPTTPALGCGVTRALRKSFLGLGNSYLPSRINWVVQSSGVDYLHLLITAMEYLIAKYDINARYLISVHDEVRYLATEEDKLRTALALQIANVWTRALFCYNLGFDDMPQGIAFFSAVDVDHVLRKETDMSCVTPSNPDAIAPGESLDIDALLIRCPSLGESRLPPLPRVDGGATPVNIFGNKMLASHQRYVTAQADTRTSPAKAWLVEQANRTWAGEIREQIPQHRAVL